MSFWGLVQIFIDIVLLATIGFLWAKLSRPQKDDPRLSRGLQLLGSKISILEDLSDRTETQVKQLTSLMEQKVREIQNILLESEAQVLKIDQSMVKSLEVAKIFQDKIPHQEIIERQNTIKYVKAARMAHQGASIEDIVAAVDLPRGEIEFIAKVNRDQLQFSEKDLPAWAKQDLSEQPGDHAREPISPNFSFEKSGITSTQFKANDPDRIRTSAPNISVPMSESEGINQSPTLKSLGEKFRQAMNQQSVPQSFQQTLIENIRSPEVAVPAPQRGGDRSSERVSEKIVERHPERQTEKLTDRNTVKKVVFPRIDY